MADTLPTDQLLELLVQMKVILTGTNNSAAGIEQVRTIIKTHPQLAYGLIRTMVSLDVVDQDAFQKTLSANLAQQQAAAARLAVNPPPSAPVPPVAAHPRSRFAPSQPQPPPPPQHQQYPQAAAPYPGGPGGPNAPPASSYQPQQQQPPTYAAPAPAYPPAVMNLPPEQREVVMRVLALTPAQLNALPPDQRDAFIQIRQQLM